MEVTTAARRFLLGQAAVTGLVQQRVFKHRLVEKVDGLGTTAIVVKRSGGWATPDPVKTIEYPVLLVEIHADHSRTATGEINVADAEDRAWGVYRVVDPILHAKRDVRWGEFGSDPGLKVVSSRRDSEPELLIGSDMHNAAAEEMLGDTCLLSCRYALEVVH